MMITSHSPCSIMKYLLLLSCIVFALDGSAAQFPGAALPSTAQEGLRVLCEDKSLKIILQSVCEPGGDVAKAIRNAETADVPQFDVLSDSDIEYSVVKEGQSCLVDLSRLELLETDNLAPAPSPAPVTNIAVASVMDDLSNDLVRYGDTKSKNTSVIDVRDGTTYTAFSISPVVCEEGFQCSLDINQTIDTQMQLMGTQYNNSLVGTCEECRAGTYCPLGTVNDNQGGLLFSAVGTNVCPQGYFCPNPSTIKDCPAGLFCPSGSAKPINCNDLGFNATQAKTNTNFEAKLEGNYCPLNSAEPWSLCPAKYYCPNASVAYTCPAGYYCPDMTMEPLECPLLSACPAGSGSPQVSWMALIGMLIIAIVVYGGSFLIIRIHGKGIDNPKDPKAAYNERVAETICKTLLPDLRAKEIVDTLKLGSLACVADPLCIRIEDLHIKFRKRVILNEVNIMFPEGSLNAIFGPSGSGKTTLIKSALGKLSNTLNVKGEVAYVKCTTNRKVLIYAPSLQTKWSKIRNIFETSVARKQIIGMRVGYVPQDNVVYDNLTVNENILFSVKLKNKNLSDDPMKMTDQILHLLGIHSIRHNRVGNPERGGISGGECRRVSIGLELAGSPACLILDEPTTGLDAVSADKVLKCLNYLTKSGMTIVASIHQPKSSIFHLFDYIHILMKGGLLVYSGPKNNTEMYFSHLGFKMPGHENPADFVIDVVSGLVNRENHPTFTTEDLPGLWNENKDFLSKLLKTSVVLSEKSEKSEKFDGDTSYEYSSDSGLYVEDLLQDMIYDLQNDLYTSPALNDTKNSYNMGINELNEMVLQLCATCVHLNHFESTLECMRHICDTYVPSTPQEALHPSGENGMGPGQELPRSLSHISRVRLVSKNQTRLQRASSYITITSGHVNKVFRLAKLFVLGDLLFKEVLVWVRSIGLKTADIVTTGVFAIILGFNQGAGGIGTQGIMYMSLLTNLYVGMLSVVWAVSFTLTRMKAAQREAGGAIPTFLIFFSAILANSVDSLLRPTVFSVLYYYISLPRITFADFYLVVVGISFSCSGLGYFIAVIFPESLAVIVGLLIAFAFGESK